MKRITYTTMPHKTGIRLIGVARNPANGFPARLLGDNSRCAPTAASTPIAWYPSAARLDVRFSITIRQHKSLHNLIEAIPEDAWTPIPYWMDGAADVAETACTPLPE